MIGGGNGLLVICSVSRLACLYILCGDLTRAAAQLFKDF
jgi:hypothetical protein